jgi:hypothetical protein
VEGGLLVETLFHIHSGVRWLIVIVAVMTFVRLAIGYFGRQPYDRSARGLVALFSTFIDIQILLGLIYFIWSGIDNDYWPRARFEHMVVMFVAAFIAHLPVRWRKSPDPLRYRNDMLVVLVVLVVVFVGVVLLPGGTARWEF